MSIFKSSFKPYVANTITNRQNLLSSRNERSIDLQRYVSSKLPWARMVSFVDYEDKIELAKKYVLYGGTLNQFPNTSGPNNQENPNLTRLRAGVAVKGGAYGSELGSREYGLRPMPGIESISSRTMSAYGSLRETTIKYFAWDLQQLQDLNRLYMKQGYPVLIEWGWSLYLDNNANLTNKIIHIDAFRKGITQESIYESIKKTTEAYYGNYEANLGIVKNYSYTLLKNGGFECTTTLISMGDVINSIKMNGGISTDSDEPTDDTSDTTTNKSNDEFTRLLSEIANGSVSFPNYNDVRESFPIRLSTETLNATSYSDLTKVLVLGDVGNTSNLPGGDSRYTKFINFGYFIHILNNYVSLFSNNGGSVGNFVKIEIPFPQLVDQPPYNNIGNGYCVSSINAMSIDNDVCFIYNSQVQILRAEIDNNISGFDDIIGFKPKAVYQEPNNSEDFADYYEPYPVNLGIIGAVYVNIGYLISAYSQQHKDGKGSVILGSYLQKILKDIEYTLGSVNDFDISSIDNKAIIIDKHYVEPISDTNKANKFEISIMGLDTTVRDHQVVSKMFEEQATLMAIAAQDRVNVAALQTSTTVELNKNIYNRLYKSVSNRSTTTPDETNASVIYKNTIKLASFVTRYIIPGKRPVYNETTLSALNSFLNQLIVVGDGGTDYKGIVPIVLQLKLDGISGITIGEIFRIKANILPSEYDDKSVGFIVTKINHEVIKSDWVTTLDAQFCLLDQDARYQASLERSNQFLADFNIVRKQTKLSAEYAVHCYNALLSYLHDFFNDEFLALNSLYPTAVAIDYQDASEYQTRKDRPMRRAFSNYASSYPQISENFIYQEVSDLTRSGFIANPPNPGFEANAYNINPNLKKEDFVSTLLSRYLTYIVAAPPTANLGVGGTSGVVPMRVGESKKIDNTIDYLNYVISFSSYYNELVKYPKLKYLFDSVFKLVVDKYKNPGGTLKSYAEVFYDFYFAGINILDLITEDIFDATTKVSMRYINPKAVDSYGNINTEELLLENPLIIDFNDY